MEIIQSHTEYMNEDFSNCDLSEVSLTGSRFLQCSFKGSAMSFF